MLKWLDTYICYFLCMNASGNHPKTSVFLHRLLYTVITAQLDTEGNTRMKAPISRTPVSYAVNEYLSWAKSRHNLTAESYKGYQYKLGVFVEFCEQHTICLEQIRRKVVNDFISHLRKSHSSRTPGVPITDRTLSGYVRAIKTMLYWCIREDEEHEFLEAIKEVSILSLRGILSVEEKIIETFSDKHIRDMLEACKLEENEYMRARGAAIVMLLNTTGVRAAECCTLTLGHCHTDSTSYIKVMGKRRREREIELPNETRRKLSAYIRKYRGEAEENDTVFVERTGQSPLTVAGLQQLIRRLGRRAKVRGVRCSPHTFRHTFAARLYCVEKKDILAISRILGHRNTKITEIYLESISSRNVQPGLRRVK